MHLTEVSIKNFRIFQGKQNFVLAPINILTGPNSSGKSSLIKFFQILSESFQEAIPITYKKERKKFFIPFYLNLDNLSSHNLGNFEEFLNENSKSKKLELELPCIFPDFKNNSQGKMLLSYHRPSAEKEVQLKDIIIRIKNNIILKIEVGTSLQETSGKNLYLKYINISEIENLIKNDGILVKSEKDNKNNKNRVISFNDYNAQWSNSNSCLENFGNIEIDSALLLQKEEIDNYFLKPTSNSKIKKEDHENLKDVQLVNSFFNNYISHIENFDKEGIPLLSNNNLSTHSNFLGYFQLFVNKKIKLNNSEFVMKHANDLITYRSADPNLKRNKKITSFSLTNHGDLIFQIINRIILLNFSFINYKILNNTSSILIKDNKFQRPIYPDTNPLLFKKLKKLKNLLKYHQVENSNIYYFNQMLSFFLNKKEIVVDTMKDHALHIQLKDEKGKKRNLSSYGYGYCKIFSIFLELLLVTENNQNSLFDDDIQKFYYHPSLILLEEPEANLHPEFQAMLAEAIVLANEEFNMQFIIETHSEYFIRKLQFLVAKKDERLKAEHVKIYYFKKPSNIEPGAEQIYELGMREDGMLRRNFGSGFFDESLKLTIDLLKLQNNN